MTRRFIAAVVGASLAVTAIGALPTRADEDLATALAAFVGIAIVGKVISDELEKDRKERAETRNRTTDDYRFINRNRTDDVITRWQPRRADRRLLPGDCLRSFETRSGRVRVFGKRCLQRNYEFSRSLPRACEVAFSANDRKRRGYDARCLRRDGYRLARR